MRGESLLASPCLNIYPACKRACGSAGGQGRKRQLLFEFSATQPQSFRSRTVGAFSVTRLPACVCGGTVHTREDDTPAQCHPCAIWRVDS